MSHVNRYVAAVCSLVVAAVIAGGQLQKPKEQQKADLANAVTRVERVGRR